MTGQLMQRVMSLLMKSQPHQLQVLRLALSYDMNSLFVTSVPQSRMLCKHVNVVDHTCKVSNYNEYLTNYKPIQRILKNTLMEILDVKGKEITKIIEEYPQLKKRSRANILNNYYNLIEAGMQKSTVASNAWLLAHENNKLIDKLDCIKVLNMDNNQLIPWLRLTQGELANYVLYTQQDMDSYTYNKMDYLAYKLECSIQQLCEVTVLNSFLMKIPLSSIDKKLSILYEYNVSNTDILKDVWVLRYSENQIRHRCELFKNTGKLKIKTWAIRCPLKVISRAIQKNTVERDLMQNCKNINEYLQNKLKVNEETLNLAVTKTPSILRVNILKLDQLIDILHQNGITSEEILRYSQILYFSVETIQNRIKILKKEGLLPNLVVLVKAKRNFDQHVKMNNMRRKLLQEHGSVKNYLINKLDVNEKLLENAITKLPSILRIKFKNLIELIDILQQNGITGNDIASHPKILHFNIKTLRERIKILKEAGVPLRCNLITRNESTLNRYKIRYNSRDIKIV